MDAWLAQCQAEWILYPKVMSKRRSLTRRHTARSWLG